MSHDSQRRRRAEDYGLVRVADGAILYERSGAVIWNFPVDQLQMVGEFTTASGPLEDDWFLVFVVGPTPVTYEAPADAVDLPRFAADLDIDLQWGLANKADFASRIMWPRILRDQPLWTFTNAVPGGGFFMKLRNAIAPLIRSELAAEARRFVERGRHGD